MPPTVLKLLRHGKCLFEALVYHQRCRESWSCRFGWSFLVTSKCYQQNCDRTTMLKLKCSKKGPNNFILGLVQGIIPVILKFNGFCTYMNVFLNLFQSNGFSVTSIFLYIYALNYLYKLCTLAAKELKASLYLYPQCDFVHCFNCNYLKWSGDPVLFQRWIRVGDTLKSYLL